jgi:hypothetical protein
LLGDDVRQLDAGVDRELRDAWRRCELTVWGERKSRWAVSRRPAVDRLAEQRHALADLPDGDERAARVLER